MTHSDSSVVLLAERTAECTGEAAVLEVAAKMQNLMELVLCVPFM